MGTVPNFEQFEWDEHKRDRNLDKHGIDFIDVMQAMANGRIVDRTHRNGEDRFIAVCPFRGRLVTVVYTVRDKNCRLISARAARTHEKEHYHQILG